jgi:hypothetical protein
LEWTFPPQPTADSFRDGTSPSLKKAKQQGVDSRPAAGNSIRLTAMDAVKQFMKKLIYYGVSFSIRMEALALAAVPAVVASKVTVDGLVWFLTVSTSPAAAVIITIPILGA